MPTLAELQHRFADAILAGADRAPAFAIAGSANPAERVAIYRRTVRTNYRNALAATYPVVRTLAGERFFDAAVDHFVEAHPSRGGDLNVYGDAFGAFLAGYAPARERPHLPDIARLEWAIDEANRAADSPRAPKRVLEAMNGVAPERLPALRLSLDPSCRLVDSAFPVFSIWQANQPGNDCRVAPDLGPQRVLVRRDPDGVTLSHVSPAVFAWLSALAAGESMAAALEHALGADAGFDLGNALHTHIGEGTIAGVGDVE
jgi:hypothetical protein